MTGVVLIVIAMVVVLPVAIFLVGGVFSALLGWLLSDEADERAEGQRV